jgi:imidazolonepropionase-like amidohydrolase
VDLSGLHVYPGLIEASTNLGLLEIESVDGSRDVTEPGALNPNARAKVAIHADSDLIPVTRANGVLVAHTVMTGSLLSGLSVIWYLDGWNWEDVTIQDPAGLHIEWPSMVASHSGWGEPKSEEDQKKEREKALEELKEAFDNARAYRKARDAMAAGGPHHETDVRWEAMIPVLDGTIPVFIHADEYNQIERALDFAREQEIRIVLVGGRDAWRLTDRLAAGRIPVIVDTLFELPRRSWEAYDAVYTVPARLQAAGVPFCISNGTAYYFTAIVRNLPYAAGMASAYGLPPEEALKSVTSIRRGSSGSRIVWGPSRPERTPP